MMLDKDQKKKIECNLCGKVLIQGYSYRRKHNQLCSKCRKLTKRKY